MDESTDSTLHERLAFLEAQVTGLREQVERLSRQMQDEAAKEAPAASTPAASTPVASTTKSSITAGPASPKSARASAKTSPKRAPRVQAARMQAALKSEDWLSRLGIALLLFGLAFLFKFGIDKGWVTPVVRVGFGAVLGVFLLGAGLKLYPKRLALGRVLLGGGIATFYVTFFAAYQFYSLVAYPLAFGGMAVVTVLCFALAVRQRDAILAIIATLGGLGTPFILYTGEGSIPGLMLYTCAVIASAGSIYLSRGWRSLLWTAAVGGWLVMLVPWFEWLFGSGGSLEERLIVQGSVVFCWLVFGVMPALREVWRRRDPGRWTVPPLKTFKTKDDLFDQPALLLVVLAPVITLGLSVELWSWSEVVWGLVEVGVAGLYAGAYLALRRSEMPRLASAHGMAAAILLAVAWFALFDDPWQWFLAVAVETAGLHFLARRQADRTLRFLGHVGFVCLVFWLAGRLLDMDGATPVLVNGEALVDLVVLALLFGTAWTFRSAQIKVIYVMTAYIGLLGWFWRDLVALPEGQAYVSIAWGLCAMVLLALGWRSDLDWVRNTGLATLLFVIGKLFLVDLAKLEAVWRILLFLGFGGLLLLLSYFFPKLWKPRTEADEEEVAPTG